VQVLSGPVGVDRDLSDVVSEIAVGMVEKSAFKDSDIVQRHEALVNARIAESLIAGEYADLPIAAPWPMSQLAAEVPVPRADFVRNVPRARLAAEPRN
jgi:hypothetical protein